MKERKTDRQTDRQEKKERKKIHIYTYCGDKKIEKSKE